MPAPTWLIDRILPAGGFAGLYGPPGVGKSFVALDMAFAVASGLPWQGLDTEPGWVVYISGEGMAGLGRRALTWLTHHQLEAADADIAWLPEALPIYNGSEDLDRLIARIEEVEKAPKLVIIDTLARCFDGDENQQFDMGRFVAGVQQLQHMGACVVAVHHTNSNESRERGNTAFRAATDTMLQVMAGIPGEVGRGGFTFVTSKQKEAEHYHRGVGRLHANLDTRSCVPVIQWLHEESESE